MNSITNVLDLQKIISDIKLKVSNFERRLATVEVGYQQTTDRSALYSTSKRIPILGETYYIDANGDAFFKSVAAATYSILLTGVITANGGSPLTASTGTQNYITRWGASNLIANSIIYDDGTNIGVGTNTPMKKLHLKVASYGAAYWPSYNGLVLESNTDFGISALLPAGNWFYVMDVTDSNGYGGQIYYLTSPRMIRLAPTKTGGAFDFTDGNLTMTSTTGGIRHEWSTPFDAGPGGYDGVYQINNHHVSPIIYLSAADNATSYILGKVGIGNTNAGSYALKVIGNTRVEGLLSLYADQTDADFSSLTIDNINNITSGGAKYTQGTVTTITVNVDPAVACTGSAKTFETIQFLDVGAGGSLSGATGHLLEIDKTGTGSLGNVYLNDLLFFQDASGGTVNNVYCNRSEAYCGTGSTLTNLYHYYIKESTRNGTISNEWVIYSANTADSSLLGKLMIGSNVAPASLLEVYSASASPVITISGLHANLYDPSIVFRTDNPLTQKAILGIDSSNDSFRIEMGAGVLGARNDFVMDSGGRIGINTSTTTSAQLAVVCAPTDSFSAVIGNITPTLSVNSNFETRGFSGNLYTSYGGFTQSAPTYGLDFTNIHNSSGVQAGDQMGIRVTYGSNLAGATITGIAAGLRIRSYAKAAITTLADIYIEPIDTTTAPTTAWCLYSSHDAPSSLLGNLMVGGNTQTVVSHTGAELGIYDASHPCIAYAEAGFGNPTDPGTISNGDKIIFYNDPNLRVTRIKLAIGISTSGALTLERAYFGTWDNPAVEIWVGTPDITQATAVARRAAYWQNDMSYVGNASIYLKEQAAAGGDIAAYGQWWVKSDTPNNPMFTDDAGTDFHLVKATTATKTTAAAPYTNDGYITVNIGGTDVRLMTTA